MPRDDADFQDYIRKRRVKPPRLLYKYTSLETAKQIIENETVLFRSPLDFNDPLDGQWNFLWQLSTKKFYSTMIRRVLSSDFDVTRVRDPEARVILPQFRTELLKLPVSKRRKRIEDLATQLRGGDIFRLPASDQLRRLRVFCLSEVPDSIPMWSYYACGHEGILLAFDMPRLERSWARPVAKVSYSRQLPKVVKPGKYIDYFAFGGDLPPIDLEHGEETLTLTKSKEWGHEKEWRFVWIEEKGSSDLKQLSSFPIHALAGIAAGCKTDLDEFRQLSENLHSKQPNAQFWRTERHIDRFELVAVKLPNPPK
jgi:hypothetical protein